MRLLVALGLVLNLSSAVLAQSGIAAMLSVEESKLRVGKSIVDAHFREVNFTIERYEGDWAWVRTNTGVHGWLPRSHTVTLDRAVVFFTQRIVKDPGNAVNYQDRATAYRLLGQYDAALGDISVAISLEPGDAAYLNSRGSIYEEKKEYERAIASYNAAIRLNPGDWMAWANAAGARYALKQYDKAVQNYSRAIQLRPGLPDLYRFRADCWFGKGDFERAIADHNRALQIDPKNIGALNGRAAIWATCPDERHRDGKRALETALQACELSAWADAQCVSTLAEAYAEVGDFQNAVKYSEQSIKLAKEQKWTDLSVLEQELALFKEGKPYRTPERL